MQIKRITKFIVALLVLTFVGQAVATAHMPCSDPTSSSQNSGTPVMDHSRHMDMVAAADNLIDSPEHSTEHCTSCVCGPGGCSTALLPVYESPFVANIRLSVNLPAYFAESHLATSLYHPPLFR